jgi:hypothetical protein
MLTTLFQFQGLNAEIATFNVNTGFPLSRFGNHAWVEMTLPGNNVPGVIDLTHGLQSTGGEPEFGNSTRDHYLGESLIPTLSDRGDGSVRLIRTSNQGCCCKHASNSMTLAAGSADFLQSRIQKHSRGKWLE